MRSSKSIGREHFHSYALSLSVRLLKWPVIVSDITTVTALQATSENNVVRAQRNNDPWR